MNATFYHGQAQTIQPIACNQVISVLDFQKNRQGDNSCSLSARNLSLHALSSTSRTKIPYRMENMNNMGLNIVSPHKKYNLNPLNNS